MSKPSPIGTVITFYSYKGGTGRTMALANTACILGHEATGDESRPDGVLMIDWDLEAPGLHHYFASRLDGARRQYGDLDARKGLVDLFFDVSNQIQDRDAEASPLTSGQAEKVASEIEYDQYIVETDVAGVSLLKAGQFNKAYSKNVNIFDWVGLFDQAPYIFSAIGNALSRRYRFVLIDSRTGETDTSGICTSIMPEKLVVVFSPNRQSLLGIQAIVKGAVEYRRESDDLRPLVTFPLPSRIESTEPGLRTQWRYEDDSTSYIVAYQPLCEKLFRDVYSLEECDLNDYFDAVQIQHIPSLSYGEPIAYLDEGSSDVFSASWSYERFTEKLISSSVPWKRETSDRRPVQFSARKVASEKRIASSRLPKGAELLIGRDEELQELDRALKSTRTHIIEFEAWGGVGKTALVADWMMRLAPAWLGINRYFDWSFYSQGTRDQSVVSSDVFIAEALAFFGDPDPKLGSPHDRGNRLAGLVAQQPTVLILDGLEPLQYGTGPLRGQLKDPAVLALLKGLAQRPFNGLCVLTTREVLTDLQSLHNKTVVHHALKHLSNTAGAALLHRSGATRRGALDIKADDKELKTTSDEVKGHALTLSLLGGYLKLAHGGDIDRRDRVGLQKASTVIEGGHAFRTIAAYERWLEAEVPVGDGGDPKQGPRQVSILRLLGLFDRPASPECLKALRQAPDIAELTEKLVGLDEENWNIAVTSLEELDLVSNQNGTLDAHPLVREYFAKQLREKHNKAWTEGHRRLFEHLCETTEKHPDTIEGLQPLYQAVAHGCQAGLYQQACRVVYVDRILRGTGNDGFYSIRMLGAIGANLVAVACFFDPPWRRVTPKLTAADQAWLRNEAASSLRALGRLTEALEPMRSGLQMAIEQEDWMNAAQYATNLSELELTLGEVTEAQSDAEQSVTFADRSMDSFQRLARRTNLGDALHQSGRDEAARDRYVEAETIQKESQPEYPQLYSLGGFRYCNLLLSEAERQAWRHCMALNVQEGKEGLWPTEGSLEKEHRQIGDAVTERANQWVDWRTPSDSLLDIGLDHLTLARTALYRWLLEAGEAKAEEATILGPKPPALTEHMTAAVNGLRESGDMAYLPRALLTQAWSDWYTNPSAAAAHLDEAWEIAERGPMPLFQADILLTRARLFFREDLATAKKNLAQARRLIEKHGYHRRDQELEDAETALRAAQEN